MPLPGFEPGSPRPQSKSDDLDCLAMGPAIKNLDTLCQMLSLLIQRLKLTVNTNKSLLNHYDQLRKNVLSSFYWY